MGPGGEEKGLLFGWFLLLLFLLFVCLFFLLLYQKIWVCRTRDILGTGGEKLPVVQADVLLTLKEGQVPGRFKCCPLYPSQSGRPQTKLEMTHLRDRVTTKGSRDQGLWVQLLAPPKNL